MDEEKIYSGMRLPGGTVVTVNQQPLDTRSDLRDFQAREFEWGYQGSGPRQLAMAILADAFDERTALEHYRYFLAEVIAQLQDDNWTIELAHIVRCLEQNEKETGESEEGDEEAGVVYVDMDLETLLKKVRGEL